MESLFKVGDKVRVNEKKSTYHNQIGEVINVLCGNLGYMIQVEFINGNTELETITRTFYENMLQLVTVDEGQDSDKTDVKIVDECSPCEYFEKVNEGMKKGTELEFKQEYQNVPVTANKIGMSFHIRKSEKNPWYCPPSLKDSDKEENPEPKFEVGDKVKIHYPDTTYHNKKAKITKMYVNKGKYYYDIDLEGTERKHTLLGLSEDKLRKVSSQSELDFG